MKIDFTKDYYKTLELQKGASADDIKKAYRRLAMKHHPDHNGDAQLFQAINEANEVLSNPQTRAQYDARHGTAAPVPVYKRDDSPRANPGTTKVVKLDEYLERLKKLYEQNLSPRRQTIVKIIEKPFEFVSSFIVAQQYDHNDKFSAKIHAMNADGSTGIWAGPDNKICMSAETMEYYWRVQDKNILMRAFNPQVRSLRRQAFNACADYRRDINEKPKYMYTEMGL